MTTLPAAGNAVFKDGITMELIDAHMGATLEPRPGVFMRVTKRKP